MAEIQNTERLPFPLAKPNEDTFATKTSEIGHRGEPLEEVIEDLDEVSGSYIDSSEFVRVETDSDKRILWAVRKNGDFYFGKGVPQQVVDYIQSLLSDQTFEELGDVLAFLDGYLGFGDRRGTPDHGRLRSLWGI